MKSAVSSRLHGLDTLRACAIAMVVSYHLNWTLPPAFHYASKIGWMGVDLFFVLSGYLIGLQLLMGYARGQQPALREFYRRRAYRILPAYLVVLALYFTVPAWREASDGISPLWEFLTFTENLFVDYSRHQAFSHVWSLCVEEHFYLVLPVLVEWLLRRPSLRKTVATIAFFVLAGIAVRSYELHVLRGLALTEDNWGTHYIERVYYPTWCRLDGLIVGVALATTQVFRPAWWAALRRYGHLLTVGGVGLVALCVWMFWERFDSLSGAAAWSTIIGFPVLSLGLGLLVASALSEGGVLARVPVPGARLIATLAFGIYLTHKEIVHLDQRWLPKLTADRTWTSAALYAVTCVAAASLLYVCVEQPFMRLRDARGGKKQDTAEEMLTEPAL